MSHEKGAGGSCGPGSYLDKALGLCPGHPAHPTWVCPAPAWPPPSPPAAALPTRGFWRHKPPGLVAEGIGGQEQRRPKPEAVAGLPLGRPLTLQIE